MENRLDSPIKTTPRAVNICLDPDIIADLSAVDYSLEDFRLVSLPDSANSLHKNGDRLWVSYADGEHCDFPYYRNNVITILEGLKKQCIPEQKNLEAFESLMRTTQNIEKRMYSSAQLSQGRNVRDLWDEVIKKINAISNESHALGNLVERLLDVPFMRNYQTSLIVLHLKGQTNAGILGSLWRGDKYQRLVDVKEFNSFFNSVKKSKIKSFASESFPKIDLPFNGSFLAKEIISKKYSMVAIASRHDFLSFDKEEIELFETCIELLQPHFDRLVEQEFSDKNVSELRVCLKDFPLPLRIKDSTSGATFLNDLYDNELQDKDIFFSKKLNGTFSLDLYDSDELRHYAFDLFHFQRISLLGELLNTLRHELSNPLFGLKLSSQIFGTLEVPKDSKDIMREVEINVNRCQVIIENFSNLYQVQNETRPVAIKKLIDEALVLSKSEARDIKKSVSYLNGTEDLKLEVPLIFVVQIIFNLIVNASQSIKEFGVSGELKLIIDSEGQEVLIDVIDNGPGISSDKASQLFKPFFTTKPQGTGLGLLLSRNLALKMGGNLEHVSTDGAKGAHFRLTIPIR